MEKNFIDVNYLVFRGKTDHKAEFSASPVGNMVKLEQVTEELVTVRKQFERMEQEKADKTLKATIYKAMDSLEQQWIPKQRYWKEKSQ